MYIFLFCERTFKRNTLIIDFYVIIIKNGQWWLFLIWIYKNVVYYSEIINCHKICITTSIIIHVNVGQTETMIIDTMFYLKLHYLVNKFLPRHLHKDTTAKTQHLVSALPLDVLSFTYKWGKSIEREKPRLTRIISTPFSRENKILPNCHKPFGNKIRFSDNQSTLS